MLSIYLLLFTFKIVAGVTCAACCYRIARWRLTPTFTYMLFCLAFSLRVALQVWAAFYTKDVLVLLRGFSPARILIGQSVEVVITACFLIGLVRRYYVVRELVQQGPTP